MKLTKSLVSLLIGFVLAVTIFGGSVYISFKNKENIYLDFLEVDRIHKVMEKSTLITFNITKLEANTRGYGLSKNTSFMDEFYKNKSSILLTISDVKRLVSESEKEHFLILEDYISQMLGILEAEISFAKTNNTSKIQEKIDEAIALSGKINEIQSKINQNQKNELDLINNQATKDLKFSKLTADIIGSSALAMTILIILFFVEYAKTHARIERELIELNDNKSKFFSIISHDLRNPVKNIVLMAQLLTEEANSKTYDPLKIASMIQGSANNLSSLLDNLLKWSRLQMNRIEVNTETLNLKKIVADVIRHQNIHASQKSIFISNHIPEEYYVLVDQNMFTTVLRNLLSNAIKFTEKGGQIDLSANQTGNYIELLVADTGVGIPDEVAEKIFSLDFKLSTKGTNKEEGTGLGLKLAKEFIEKNKGSIRLESALKKGTKFYVSIPSA